MVEVRSAQVSDAYDVRDLWAAVAAEGEWIGTELPLRDDWAERFISGVGAPNSTWFVAEADQRIIGGLFMSDDAGLAHLGMAVADGYRGKGVGRALVTAGIDWARAQGCHKVALEMWPHNDRARRLYTWAGFIEEGRLRRHYRRHSGALWDVVAMGLILDLEAPDWPS